MGLFGLFGSKKKKGPQPTPGNTSQPGQNQTTPTPEQKILQSLPKPVKVKQNEQDEPDQWIYDSIMQYLTSPLWKVPIYSFIDETCIIFDDEEENKFAYTDAHNKFKKMIEDLLTNLLNDLGVTEEQFLSIVNKGLAIQQHKKVFEQLLIADNFMVFKKLMLKRNKELELEAMKQLEEQSNPEESHSTGSTNTTANPEVQKLTLEKEQAEIEEAIARSLAAEQEMAKLQEYEDEELQKILKQSQQEYEMQEAAKRKQEQEKVEELARKQADLRKAEEDRKKQEAERLKQSQAKSDQDAMNQQKSATESPDKKDIEVSKSQNLSNLKDLPPVSGKKPAGKLDPIADHPNEESKSRLPELTTSQWKSSLPPIGKKNYDAFSNEELIKEKEQISKKLETINAAPKQEISQESLEERKKRLQAQRELILKKKQLERENELKRYEESQQTGVQSNLQTINNDLLESGATTTTTTSVDQKEADKRKAIYSQLKKDV